MDFELPRGANREYLIIFGVAAVYVGACPGGASCVVGVTRDLERTAAALDGLDIASAFWVADKPLAIRLAAAVRAGLPQDAAGQLAVPVDKARAAIEATAVANGVLITDHEVAMARVQAAVERVSEYIARANSTGQLAWFNAAYRDWRLQAKKNFWPGMSYTEALARLRRIITKQLITTEVIRMDANILREIFPDLSVDQRRRNRLTG